MIQEMDELSKKYYAEFNEPIHSISQSQIKDGYHLKHTLVTHFRL